MGPPLLSLPPRFGEGGTPLVESARIGPSLGLRLRFKLEICNPSGSYKDRFVAAEMEASMRRGMRACVATSSGNTGAALAAWCARANLPCAIFVNELAPAGKLLPMRAHGVRVFRIRDFITSPEVTAQVYARLERMAEAGRIRLIVSAYRYCPEGMRGVEEIAGELLAQERGGVDHVFVPVGGGGLFAAVCQGFRRGTGRLPRVHAVQPEGCATVVAAYRENRQNILPVASTTRISGLAVPFDLDAGLALAQLRANGGRGIAIADEEVFTAQRRMLREEGIWCEPAGAAALAGCLRAHEQGWIAPGATVVCLVTGHGFKDPASLAAAVPEGDIAVIDQADIGQHLLEARV